MLTRKLTGPFKMLPEACLISKGYWENIIKVNRGKKKPSKNFRGGEGRQPEVIWVRSLSPQLFCETVNENYYSIGVNDIQILSVSDL